MATVHLVYPSGPAISCPDAIGRHLGRRLSRRYEVIHHEWDEVRVVRPGPDSVLLGHPHPAPWTVFRMSSRLPGWKRVVAMAPYSHGDPRQLAYADTVLRRCDLFVAITGRYWFDRMQDSPFSHWIPKVIRADLAVDREEFPRVKGRFPPPDQRRFVYVGHSGWQKNTEYLAAIAARLDPGTISWAGGGAPIPGVRALGQLDFRTETAHQLLAQHDFLLTVGRSDANPASVLEAMSWGLIPVCTPQSGYAGEAGIANVPLDDPEAAAAIIRELRSAPEARLESMRAANEDALDRRYTWDRFAQVVQAAIESRDSPPLAPQARSSRSLLRSAAFASPYAPWRPARIADLLLRQAVILRRRFGAGAGVGSGRGA